MRVYWKAARTQPDERLQTPVLGGRVADSGRAKAASAAAHVHQLGENGHAADGRGQSEHLQFVVKHEARQ
jgi:hypothetical protein